MNNITIKNVSTATVYLFVPSIKFNRELVPGRVVPVTQEEYDELTFDPGFMSLLNSHYITVNGVEEDKQVEVIKDVYEADQIAQMLDKLDVTAFAKFIPKATDAEKESVINLAVEKGITQQTFVALIKKYCDVDIIKAINMKHEAEEK